MLSMTRPLRYSSTNFRRATIGSMKTTIYSSKRSRCPRNSKSPRSSSAAAEANPTQIRFMKLSKRSTAAYRCSTKNKVVEANPKDIGTIPRLLSIEGSRKI